MSTRRSRKHHFIPEGIQKKFKESDRLFRCKLKNNCWIVEPANPENTAYIKNLNTYNELGELNDNLEKYFSKEIDNKICKVTDFLETNSPEELTSDQWKIMSLYSIMLVHRHPLLIYAQQSGVIDNKTKKPSGNVRDIFSTDDRTDIQDKANWMAKAHFRSALNKLNNSRLSILFNESSTPFILSDSYLRMETTGQYVIDTTCIPITKRFAIQLFGVKDDLNHHKVLTIKEPIVQRFNTLSFSQKNLIAISGSEQILNELLNNNQYYSNSKNIANDRQFACDNNGVYYPLLPNDDLSNVNTIYGSTIALSTSVAIRHNRK